MFSLVPKPPVQTMRQELALSVIIVVRSLSENSGCRIELLNKDTVYLMQKLVAFIGMPVNLYCPLLSLTYPLTPITSYTDDRGRLFAVRALHNFLRIPSLISDPIFCQITTLVGEIVSRTKDVRCFEYCSACMHTIAEQKCRANPVLVDLTVKSLLSLIIIQDPLVQFFVVASCGLLFKHRLTTEQPTIQLADHLFEKGEGMKAPYVAQALTSALALIMQDTFYCDIIVRNKRLNSMADLLFCLHDSNPEGQNILQLEGVCIGICHAACNMDLQKLADPLTRRKIVSLFTQALYKHNVFILQTAINCVATLIKYKVCAEDLVLGSIIRRVAVIISRHLDLVDLCRSGCALLGECSFYDVAHPFLASRELMKVLFKFYKSEDDQSKEYVATALCSISLNPIATDFMISMGIIEMFSELATTNKEVGGI